MMSVNATSPYDAAGAGSRGDDRDALTPETW